MAIHAKSHNQPSKAMPIAIKSVALTKKYFTGYSVNG
jgi:hypothetical protein